MTLDARSTPVTCDNPHTLALYETALREYQGYVGDPVATIDRALAEQPDFVLGHAFRAAVLMTFGERRFAAQAAESVAAALNAGARANDRERGLVAAARRLVEGDWDGGCATYDAVLVDHPRDALALQTAHLFDFFRGDSLDLRNRVSRVLPSWSPSDPGFAFVLGMHAFGLEECNQYGDAEDAARRSLASEPRDVWAVHAGTHCMEMQGWIDRGIDWLESRIPDWAPDNSFAYHNWWHLALFYLDRGDDRRVLELHDQRILPQPSDFSLQLVDASSLLWRLHLLGVDTGDRFDAVADAWEAKLDVEHGFYAFNDVHAMMAFAATGRASAAERAVRSLDAGAYGAEVGLPIARALLAFEARRFDEVVDLLLPVRDRALGFGGSHAQRDVVTLTMIVAALECGRGALAQHYLAERRVHRPASSLGRRLATLA